MRSDRMYVNRLTQTVERMAGDLVRMALFTEYRRHPLRRDDVMKKSRFFT